IRLGGGLIIINRSDPPVPSRLVSSPKKDMLAVGRPYSVSRAVEPRLKTPRWSSLSGNDVNTGQFEVGFTFPIEYPSTVGRKLRCATVSGEQPYRSAECGHHVNSPLIPF